MDMLDHLRMRAGINGDTDVCWKAANRIESDAKAIAALREALKPFATMAICAVRTLGDADTDMCLLVPLKYLDAARTALSNEQNAGESK